MKRTKTMQRVSRAAALGGGAALAAVAWAADVPANLKPALGSQPDAAMLPKSEFVFEEYVTLAPVVVQWFCERIENAENKI